MERFTFETDEESKGRLIGLTIGYLQFENVRNGKSNEISDSIVEAACSAVQKKFPEPDDILEDTVVLATRALFSSIGRDPTKERPSGEALIRRVAKGKGIYRISIVVDINNAVSMLSGFPCGVYDASKIEGGAVTVLLGGEGLEYEGLGGRMVEAGNRLLTADSRSVFGGPTADSLRTAVTEGSEQILMIIYSPPGIEPAMLKATMDRASLFMQRATGCGEAYRGMHFVK